MGWVLRLVETGIDSPPRVIDVMDIEAFGDLGDIAKLGLTLSEAKQILARLQRMVVAVQADDHAVLRPDCSSCGQPCHVKDWRLHRVATLFGPVPVRLPRFRCASCGHGETGNSWRSYC
jgi:transposase